MTTKLRERYAQRSSALDEVLQNLDFPDEADFNAFLASIGGQDVPETPRYRAEDHMSDVSDSDLPGTGPTEKVLKFIAGQPPQSTDQVLNLLVRFILLSKQFVAPACAVTITSSLRRYYLDRGATLADLKLLSAENVEDALIELQKDGLVKLFDIDHNDAKADTDEDTEMAPSGSNSAAGQVIVASVTNSKKWRAKISVGAHRYSSVPWNRAAIKEKIAELKKPGPKCQPCLPKDASKDERAKATNAMDVWAAPKLFTFSDKTTPEELISAPTHTEQEQLQHAETLRRLIAAPTAKQRSIQNRFRNTQKKLNSTYCPIGDRRECARRSKIGQPCHRLHFRKVIKPWTDISLGDCSYLDTCRHPSTCKFVHYTADLSAEQAQILKEMKYESVGTDTVRINEVHINTRVDFPPQWICCDLRTIDLKIFRGIAKVVMADPPWDIHMDLPYGTMTDDEMRALPVANVHDEGMLFLWVTGRAMELARECMSIWGYRRVEEIIWCKTNQLQRIIRTGRTGHWINHSKEHCLVGIKGNPTFNKNIDCDVIVSEVRETSRKPDEIYNLVERMCPDCLKVELFGRMHNTHRNWVTLGNQLDPTRIIHEELGRRLNEHLEELEQDPIEIYDPALHKEDRSTPVEVEEKFGEQNSRVLSEMRGEILVYRPYFFF